jgi:DNA-binding transcriptional ArsR family regulator
MKIAMLAPILGSVNAERVLIYLAARDEGYGREIARFFGADPDSIQKQLVKFEAGGILISRELGRTVTYQFNPRYPFLAELKDLVEKAIRFYPEEERERLNMPGQRPRRRGKPQSSGS